MSTTKAPTGFGRPIWSAIKGGNQVHGVGLAPVCVSFSLPAHAAGSFVSIPIFTAPPQADGGYWKVEKAYLVWSGGDISGDSTNYWAMGLGVMQDTNSDGTIDHEEDVTDDAMTFSPGGVTFYEYDPREFDVVGPEGDDPFNVFLESGDTLALIAYDVGGGTLADISSRTFTVTVLMRHSPPGR